MLSDNWWLETPSTNVISLTTTASFFSPFLPLFFHSFKNTHRARAACQEYLWKYRISSCRGKTFILCEGRQTCKKIVMQGQKYRSGLLTLALLTFGARYFFVVNITGLLCTVGSCALHSASSMSGLCTVDANYTAPHLWQTKTSPDSIWKAKATPCWEPLG